MNTFNRLVIEARIEFTTNFMPSFFDTSFNGLRALRARIAFKKEMSMPLFEFSKIQLSMEMQTIKKSSLL